MNERELAELDLAVAKAEGIPIGKEGFYWNLAKALTDDDMAFWDRYCPTRDPAEALRLLEKYHLGLRKDDPDPWQCCYEYFDGDFLKFADGETPCIAICKAVVALVESRQ